MARNDLIEQFDNKSYPSHKGTLAGILIVFGGFIAYGVYSLMQLWATYGTDVMNLLNSIGVPSLIMDNLWLIGVGILAIIVMSYLFALGASALAKRLGGTLIYVGAGFMLIFTWLPVILLVGTGLIPLSGLIDMWFIMIPGLLNLLMILLLFTVFKERVRRAGEIIKLTGQVCLDEKGVFIPSLLTMFFTLISALLFGAIIFQFTPPEVLFGTQDLTVENGWPLGLGLVLYLFVTIFFYNMSYGTTSGIVYIYMRGRDPSLGDGFKASLSVLTGLAALAVMSVVITIVRMILERLGREAGPGGAVVGGVASGIIGWVWMLINYFTIPSMVAEGIGAKDGIKRSAGMVKRNFVDVMIKETAVRWGFGVLAGVIFLGFAIGGAAFGWIMTYDIIMTIIVAVLFIILAAIPSTLVLRTFDIVYVTLLYVFIRRKEGDVTGKNAIPSEMNRELDKAYTRAQRSGPI